MFVFQILQNSSTYKHIDTPQKSDWLDYNIQTGYPTISNYLYTPFYNIYEQDKFAIHVVSGWNGDNYYQSSSISSLVSVIKNICVEVKLDKSIGDYKVGDVVNILNQDWSITYCSGRTKNLTDFFMILISEDTGESMYIGHNRRIAYNDSDYRPEFRNTKAHLGCKDLVDVENGLGDLNGTSIWLFENESFSESRILDNKKIIRPNLGYELTYNTHAKDMKYFDLNLTIENNFEVALNNSSFIEKNAIKMDLYSSGLRIMSENPSLAGTSNPIYIKILDENANADGVYPMQILYKKNGEDFYSQIEMDKLKVVPISYDNSIDQIWEITQISKYEQNTTTSRWLTVKESCAQKSPYKDLQYNLAMPLYQDEFNQKYRFTSPRSSIPRILIYSATTADGLVEIGYVSPRGSVFNHIDEQNVGLSLCEKQIQPSLTMKTKKARQSETQENPKEEPEQSSSNNSSGPELPKVILQYYPSNSRFEGSLQTDQNWDMGNPYPNPVVKSGGMVLNVPVSLPQTREIVLTVHNSAGQKIAELIPQGPISGQYTFTFRLDRNLNYGAYFVRLDEKIDAIGHSKSLSNQDSKPIVRKFLILPE